MSAESLEDELERLRRQERDRLHGDITRLSQSIDNLSTKVEKLAPQSALKELADDVAKLAPSTDLKALSERVTTLENYKWLIVGGFGALVGLQGAQAFFAWLLKTPSP